MASLGSATEVNARFLRALRVRDREPALDQVRPARAGGGEVQAPSLALQGLRAIAHGSDLCADTLSEITCTSRWRGVCRPIHLKNATTSWPVWRLRVWCRTCPVANVGRSEQVDGTVALVVVGKRCGCGP